MKAKHLIKALQMLNPEHDVIINIKQYNKRYGFQLPIEYGSDQPEDSYYLNSWVNGNYGGSITVHLPDGAYVVGLPEDMKPI